MVINLSHIPALQDNGFMFKMHKGNYNMVYYSKEIYEIRKFLITFNNTGNKLLIVFGNRPFRNSTIQIYNPTFEDLNYWHQQISGNPLNLLEHPAVNRV